MVELQKYYDELAERQIHVNEFGLADIHRVPKSVSLIWRVSELSIPRPKPGEEPAVFAEKLAEFTQILELVFVHAGYRFTEDAWQFIQLQYQIYGDLEQIDDKVIKGKVATELQPQTEYSLRILPPLK